MPTKFACQGLTSHCAAEIATWSMWSKTLASVKRCRLLHEGGIGGGGVAGYEAADVDELSSCSCCNSETTTIKCHDEHSFSIHLRSKNLHLLAHHQQAYRQFCENHVLALAVWWSWASLQLVDQTTRSFCVVRVLCVDVWSFPIGGRVWGSIWQAEKYMAVNEWPQYGRMPHSAKCSIGSSVLRNFN